MSDTKFIVLGSGVSGFCIASALREKGESVKVVTIGPGASSLSSGAWDIGPIGKDGPQTFEEVFEQHTVPALQSFFIEWETPFSAQDCIESLKKVQSALSDQLSFTLQTDKPLLLPSTHGNLRRVFSCQSLLAKCNLNSDSAPRSIGLVFDPHWNFPAPLLCEKWNEQAKKLSLAVNFQPFPISMNTSPINLEAVAASLETSQAQREVFLDALRPLKSKFDLVLFPPLGLSTALVKELEAFLGTSVSEPLCSRETAAGRRLYRALQASFKKIGVTDVVTSGGCRFHWDGQRVSHLNYLDSQRAARELGAERYVLATGKFLGKGFRSEGTRWEASVTGLPLYVEKNRLWNETAAPFYQYARLGLRVDSRFRPYTFSGEVAHNVHAIGSCIGGAEIGSSKLGLGVQPFLGSLCAKKMAQI